jgi:HPt (histidine-containing phosphotransfer) domain-containing protein
MQPERATSPADEGAQVRSAGNRPPIAPAPAHVLCGAAVACVFVSTMASGQTRSPLIWFLAAVPAAAGYLLGRRPAAAWGAVAMLACVGVEIVRRIYPIESDVPVSSSLVLASVGALIALTTALAGAIARPEEPPARPHEPLEAAPHEAASEPERRAPFDLRGLVQDAIEVSAAAAAERGVTLTVAIAEGTPARVSGDATRLRQVLADLLGDAVRAAEKRAITVSVSAREAADGAVEIACVVRDAASSIPAFTFAFRADRPAGASARAEAARAEPARAEAAPAVERTTPAPEDVLDQEVLAGLRRLFARRQGDLRAMMEEYLRSAERHLATIDGALAQGDTRTAQESAHSFKGVSGQMGAKQVMTLALHVEKAATAGDVDRACALLATLRAAHEAARPFLLEACDAAAGARESIPSPAA